MAAGLRNIKTHIKSISNIKKITNSMKLVAISKFAKVEKALKHARKFGEGAKRFYEINSIPTDTIKGPSIIIAVTSDRGLCGPMHGKICKYIETNFLQKNLNLVKLICLGEKSKNILAGNYKKYIQMVVNGIGIRNPTFLGASSIAQMLLSNYDYLFGNIVYAKFRNLVTFEVNDCEVYHLNILIGNDITFKYAAENENADILSYLEFSTSALIYYSLIETYATELASRITSMTNSSKSAGKMAQKLQLEFNKRRQNSITLEITDIVSGASSVVKKK